MLSPYAFKKNYFNKVDVKSLKRKKQRTDFLDYSSFVSFST